MSYFKNGPFFILSSRRLGQALPEHYWPDCVPCIKDPETRMKNHARMLPPN
jgi:hypothetical protein